MVVEMMAQDWLQVHSTSLGRCCWTAVAGCWTRVEVEGRERSDHPAWV